MATPIEPQPPADSSVLSRILFFAVGLVALGVGTLITLGAALAGALSIGLAAYLFKRRGRRLTRRGAWFSSVGGTVAVLAVLISLAVLSDDSVRRAKTPAERAAEREKASAAMPDWLKAINPSAQRQSASADSIATMLLENQAVVIWSGIMGAVIASAMLGTIAGSFGWGGVMLLYRGVFGRWIPSSRVPAESAEL